MIACEPDPIPLFVTANYQKHFDVNPHDSTLIRQGSYPLSIMVHQPLVSSTGLLPLTTYVHLIDLPHQRTEIGREIHHLPALPPDLPFACPSHHGAEVACSGCSQRRRKTWLFQARPPWLPDSPLPYWIEPYKPTYLPSRNTVSLPFWTSTILLSFQDEVLLPYRYWYPCS